jgi:hypothetical protein
MIWLIGSKEHSGCVMKNNKLEGAWKGKQKDQINDYEIQARNNGELHKGGVKRDKTIWMDSDYILELQTPRFMLD